MCAVSAILGQFQQRWLNIPNTDPSVPYQPNPVWRFDYEKLRSEIDELKKLIPAAQRFDEATGQTNCDDAEKVELLRKLAKLVHVDINDLFPWPA